MRFVFTLNQTFWEVHTKNQVQWLWFAHPYSLYLSVNRYIASATCMMTADCPPYRSGHGFYHQGCPALQHRPLPIWRLFTTSSYVGKVLMQNIVVFCTDFVGSARSPQLCNEYICCSDTIGICPFGWQLLETEETTSVSRSMEGIRKHRGADCWLFSHPSYVMSTHNIKSWETVPKVMGRGYRGKQALDPVWC